MKNKRLFKRVDKQFLASYDTLNQDNEVQDSGMAIELDMSLAGLQLEIPTKPNLGDTLRVVLALEDELITVIGEVVWVESSDEMFIVGINLTKIQKNYKDKVKVWVEKSLLEMND